MAYTTLQDTMQRNAAKEASEEAKLKRASSAYRHAGGVKSGLGERSCFLVSVTCSCVHERYRGKGRKYPPPWRPDDWFAPQVLFDVISSQQRLVGPQKKTSIESRTCSVHHPHPYQAGGFWPGHSSLDSWGRIVRRATRLPAGILAALRAVDPHHAPGKRVGWFAWARHGGGPPPRRLSDSGARGWKRSDRGMRILAALRAVDPHHAAGKRVGRFAWARHGGGPPPRRLSNSGARGWERSDRGMRQSEVAIPPGVEHVELRARAIHERNDWLVIVDWSNASNTVNRKAELAEVAIFRSSARAVKRPCEHYGIKPADAFFFRVDYGESRALAYSSGSAGGA